MKTSNTKNEPIKATPLPPAGHIGIVSPAYWMEQERMQTALARLQSLGYSYQLGACAKLKENRFAGSPEQRADEIMAMFADPAIDAIVCARGGYGSNRVATLLDYHFIRQHPKIFIGYSDITGLLTSMAQQAGLVTFHGPMLTTFADYPEKFNLDTFQQVLSGQKNIQLGSVPACQAHTLISGEASGPCWGGNLSLLIARLGTPGQIDLRGAILFLEEIDEEIYAFERMLLHLKDSGSLENLHGLVIGEMTAMHDGDIAFGKTIDEIVLEICTDMSIPIISHFPCGHGRYQSTLPISHTVELHAHRQDPFILIPTAPLETG